MAIASGPLQLFVEDELMRTPLLVDQVVDGALDHLRKGMAGMAPHDRSVASDLLQRALANRQHLVDRYVKSLREHIAADEGKGASASAPPRELKLSLVDEEEVAIDVAISHTIEAIRSVAEYELRELQTFVSALVGDMDVARDHNPFRPETHARALWAASQALPLPRGYQLTFMRHASMSLADMLRKTYAAASSRLEAAGVEPASHRTLILPSGSRRSRPNESQWNPDLHGIRDRMPVRETAAPSQLALEQALQQADDQWRNLPADTDFAERGRIREQQRERLVESAANQVDQQMIELLSRLFDAILSDPQLEPDIQLLLSRLQAPALRVALRDPKTLDKDSHPLWQFMDQLAFLGETLPEPGEPVREGALRLVQGLIDQIVEEAEQTRTLYVNALEQLHLQAQHRLEQRCGAASNEIAALQPLEDRLDDSASPLSTLHGTLDVAQLDTVPAELIDTEPAQKKPAHSAAAWLDQIHPGQWVRMFMQGRWVAAQLLWPGERGELFLFGDGSSETTWAVRRRALLTLHSESLLDAMTPRSLVRDAAKNVMRRLARAG